MALKCGCYMLICTDQLVCAWKSGARSENDHRICKVENGSLLLLYQYFQSGDDSGKNDHAYSLLYYRRFSNLHTAVTTVTDDNVTIVRPCASIPCKLDFFYFS